MATAPSLPGAQAATALVLELMPSSEYLLRNDAPWMKSLLTAYNAAYAIGYRIMMIILVALVLVLAPFLGFFGACVAYMMSVTRQAAVLVGRSLADALGYGEYVRTRAQYFAWKRAKHAPSVAVRLPATGASSMARYPAFHEEEVALGDAQSCWTSPVKAYNALYSGGFAVATVMLAVLTFVCAPFIGALIAASNMYVMIGRTNSRVTGRIFLDIFGVQELATQHVAFMREEMGLDDNASLLAEAPASYGTSPSGGGGGGGNAVVLLSATSNPLPAGVAVYQQPIVPVVVPPAHASRAAPPAPSAYPMAAAPAQIMPVHHHMGAASAAAPMYPMSEDPAVPVAPSAPSMYPTKDL